MKKASSRNFATKNGSIVTEKKTLDKTETQHLFENNFAYATNEGEVILKGTDLFEERTLTTVEPESVDAQIEAYESAFDNITSRIDSFFDEISSAREIDPEKTSQHFNTLIEEITSSDAIGDFEALVSGSKEKLSALLESKAGEETKEVEAEAAAEEKKPDEPTEKETGETAEIDSKEEVKAKPEEPESETAAKAEEDEPIDEEVPEKAAKTKSQDKEKPEADIEAETEITAKNGESVAEEKTEKKAESETLSEEKGTAESEKPEAETDTGEIKAEEAAADAKTEEEESKEDTPEDYYKHLAGKAETLLELSDWSYATLEFDNIDLKWSEGPETEGADLKPYRDKIDSLREQLEEKKKAHYEEQKRIREKNLEKKTELLNQLGQIIEDKKWTHTRDIARIKGKWEQIKPVPASEQEKLEAAFNAFIKEFEEHKVDRLVKQKQQEEDNLTGKLVILEKMEKFLNSVDESANWKDLENKFSDFARQFRKIGRIPIERNQETWDRFHKAQDTFHSMRFKYDAKYRKDIEKFLSKKKQLIDEAEALIDADDLAKASRKVNKLHRRWKKIGNLPQKDENDMWDRFKAATDAFNDRKTENIDQLREQEDKNYQKKLDIIEKANELKESEEWEQTHKEYQKLMDQWKAVGPVPKRKSGKIWKKFKGTMDEFYDRRRDHFKEVKEERKDNLKEKEDVLDQLKELKSHEDPIKAVELAKPLQEEFKKAGYVPIKHKNRMWKEYRETCDVIYERFRATKSAAQIVGKKNVDHYSADDITDIKKKQDQANKLRKEIGRLSSELIQMKESLSYFKPSSKGSSLLDEVKSKIDKAEEDINKKEEKLQNLEIEIDKIKRSS